jgi:hypothetical protein
MKKVIFTLEGKRFEIELEHTFATYVENNLKEHGIVVDRNNEASKLLKAYLTVLKENYGTEEQIKILLNNIP